MGSDGGAPLNLTWCEPSPNLPQMRPCLRAWACAHPPRRHSPPTAFCSLVGSSSNNLPYLSWTFGREEEETLRNWREGGGGGASVPVAVAMSSVSAALMSHH